MYDFNKDCVFDIDGYYRSIPTLNLTSISKEHSAFYREFSCFTQHILLKKMASEKFEECSVGVLFNIALMKNYQEVAIKLIQDGVSIQGAPWYAGKKPYHPNPLQVWYATENNMEQLISLFFQCPRFYDFNFFFLSIYKGSIQAQSRLSPIKTKIEKSLEQFNNEQLNQLLLTAVKQENLFFLKRFEYFVFNISGIFDVVTPEDFQRICALQNLLLYAIHYKVTRVFDFIFRWYNHTDIQNLLKQEPYKTEIKNFPYELGDLQLLTTPVHLTFQYNEEEEWEEIELKTLQANSAIKIMPTLKKI